MQQRPALLIVGLLLFGSACSETIESPGDPSVDESPRGNLLISGESHPLRFPITLVGVFPKSEAAFVKLTGGHDDLVAFTARAPLTSLPRFSVGILTQAGSEETGAHVYVQRERVTDTGEVSVDLKGAQADITIASVDAVFHSEVAFECEAVFQRVKDAQMAAGDKESIAYAVAYAAGDDGKDAPAPPTDPTVQDMRFRTAECQEFRRALGF